MPISRIKRRTPKRTTPIVGSTWIDSDGNQWEVVEMVRPNEYFARSFALDGRVLMRPAMTAKEVRACRSANDIDEQLAAAHAAAYAERDAARAAETADERVRREIGEERRG